MISRARAGSVSAQQHVARAKVREPGVLLFGQFGDRDRGEYLFGLLALAEPRQRVRPGEKRFRSGGGAGRRVGQPIREGKICQADRALGSPQEQVRIGLEVGVKTQRGAPHHHPQFVTVVAGGEFCGDESTQPAQPRGRRAFPTHLAVQRVRHPDVDAGAGVLESDQATGVGLFHRVWIRDPPQC